MFLGEGVLKSLLGCRNFPVGKFLMKITFRVESYCVLGYWAG